MVPALIAATAPAGTFAGVGVKLRLPAVPSALPSGFTLCARQYMRVLITGVGLWEPICPKELRTLSNEGSTPGPKCAGMSGSTSIGIAIIFVNISSTMRTKLVKRICRAYSDVPYCQLY